uniref:Putative YadA domain-containing structural protein n=1 Tax=viral metagenome TaxID=1070528 RepID=A0A6H1ZFC9_9ZZZZ
MSNFSRGNFTNSVVLTLTGLLTAGAILVLGLLSTQDIKPTSNNTYDIGTATSSYAEVFASSTVHAGGVTSTGNVNPFANDTYDIGSGLLAWKDVYASGTSNLTYVRATSSPSTAPGFAFTGDTDTGMYQPNASQLNFAVNGARIIEMNASAIYAYKTVIPSGIGALDLGNGLNSWKDIYASSTIVTPRISGSTSSLAVGTGNTNHTLASANDLFVTGKLEVDGITYFDEEVKLTGNKRLVFGGGNNTGFIYETDEVSSHAMHILAPLTGKNVVLTNMENLGLSFDHAASPNPTIFFHSATNPDTNNTQWGSLSHSVQNFVIDVGTGALAVDASVVPSSTASYDLGSAALSWKSLYTSSIAYLGGVSSTGSIYPTADNTYDLGSASLAWHDIIADGTVTGVTVNGTTQVITPVSLRGGGGTGIENDSYSVGIRVEGSEKWTFTSNLSGHGGFHLLPVVTATSSLGSPALSLLNVYASGTIFANNYTGAANATTTFTSNATDASGQTAFVFNTANTIAYPTNLFDFRNNGTTKVKCDSNGSCTFGANVSFDASNGRLYTGNVQLRGVVPGEGSLFPAVTAASVPITITGATAQATDLQRWNNVSAATIARVTANGSIYSSSTVHAAGVTSTGHVNPFATNIYDLGSPLYSWKDVYASGTAYITNFSASSGRASLVSYGFKGAPSTGMYYSPGALHFVYGGDPLMSLDSNTGLAGFGSTVSPLNNDTFDLGTPVYSWANIYASGTAMIGGGSAGKATCFKADGKSLGFCSSAVGAGGDCTCN